MTSTVPHLGELVAHPAWRTVDFVSDLHLQAQDPLTLATWSRYLQTCPADALIILGDLFEVWVGDDELDDPSSFERRCCDQLREAAVKRDIFFMHGNRDFLVGTGFAQRANASLLTDPTVLQIFGQNWLLSHGDALCLADTEYMAFRAMVRSDAWRNDFLAKPLPERRELARQIRERSEQLKHSATTYADADTALACQWLHAANAQTLIHGHTHRPHVHAMHADGESFHRIVLSDWDANAQPARAQVLRLNAAGLSRISL